jgi:NADP-dependent 3-hydroxy acid dehydrogenase YdfG
MSPPTHYQCLCVITKLHTEGSTYCATKTAITAFSEELRNGPEYNIRVT